MSEESKRLRFFVARTELTEYETHHFTHVDNVTRVGLVALRRDDIVGIGRFDVVRDGVAEVAFAVADAVQGLGVGSLLLDRLVVEAQRRGVTTFVAHTLPENEKMLELFRHSGLTVKSSLEGGECTVTLDLVDLATWKVSAAARDDSSGLHSLARILEPSHVAVVGVGRSPTSLGRSVAANILEEGFAGTMTPVNVDATVSVGGIPSVHTVFDLPVVPDVVIVVVPAPAVADVVDACGERGVAGCVVITAGFAETGPEGREREQEMVRRAHSYGMRIIGPNCIGIVNAEVGMNATFMPGRIPRGNIGFASQSGAMGIALLARARETGIGISSFVSLGNASDITSHDVIRYWGEHRSTKVGLLYLESLGNPRTFVRVARHVAESKPIIALKSGRSAVGQVAGRSHTAAQATPDTAVQAVFDRAGIVRVTTLGELLETAVVFSACDLPTGSRIGVVSNAGGPAILAADACAEAGLELVAFDDELQRHLRDLGSAGVRNPVDLGAGAVPATYRAAVREICRVDAVDALMIIIAPLPEVPVREVVKAVTDPTANPSHLPLVVVTLGVPTESQRRAAHDTPLIAYPENAAYALGRLAHYASWRRDSLLTTPDVPPEVEFERGHALCAAALDEHGPGWLDAATTTALLEAYGVDVVASRVASPHTGEVVDAARALGFPLVLKAVGRELLHKTERHGVELNVTTIAHVERTLHRFIDEIGADLEGVLLQEMVTEPAVEVIIGGINDPAFGPLIMCGTGGVLSDVVKDTKFAVAPLSPGEARALLASTGVAALLESHRGAAAFGVNAVIEVLVRVSHLLADRPEIIELDCNPLLVLHQGAVVVDARIRVGEVAFALEGVRSLD
ncbi:MAG: GNAT family N-acetyltransferase [Acidobacteriota bacterium]|nr:GNAT family N-acetyltransferase [Acidobacteriota bacterium]